jgi:hypothetical protein
MHTLGDPIVPYWHETLYGAKVLQGGSASKYFEMPRIYRYGTARSQRKKRWPDSPNWSSWWPVGREKVLLTPELRQSMPD